MKGYTFSIIPSFFAITKIPITPVCGIFNWEATFLAFLSSKIIKELGISKQRAMEDASPASISWIIFKDKRIVEEIKASI